ncbi:T9SS type A sorting domain-containing protein [Dyadobacter tibetensis]|uniref:T9SS type A sorting domain-containing protein n=1 Tax=Dyadobacter tibetensis TaxID=1211851 RepID=UPI00046E708E|nr:T9SS type A sorting domain-containing protein [Dyadobacter tibetensis]
MKQRKLHILLSCIALLAGSSAFAQMPGSSNTENSSRYIGGTRTSLAETLYIGPDANITVDGVWNVYSKYVWISPQAIINGTGNIVFHNPTDVGGSAGATNIDGNNNIFIDVNIVHDNNQGMEIKNVALDPSLAAAGWSNDLTASTLKIGKDFNLNTDGADVWLDSTSGVTGDFVFDENASISNYRPNRMVITNNSIQSHMVKMDASAGFVFPIGISDGNYTPAQLTGSGNYHVSVQDYTASTSNEALLAGGPQRTWHVYADAPASTTVALQHLVANDTPPFDSADPHFVTQYDGSAWSTTTEESALPATLTTGVTPVPGSSLQDLAAVSIPASANSPASYLTKANVSTALPVTLVRFTAALESQNVVQLSWTTSEEINADRFEIQRSPNAKDWSPIATVAATGTTNVSTSYTYTDTKPGAGKQYYRLKMIDRDFTYTYSRLAYVGLSENSLQLAFFPNPTSDRLSIMDSKAEPIDPAQLKGIMIYNVKGTVVFQSSKSQEILENGIDVRAFPTGTYIIKTIYANGTYSNFKVLKVN